MITNDLEKLLDVAMLLQQKLVLGFNINLEMNLLWTWTLSVPCDALIGGNNGFLHGIIHLAIVHNGSKHSCGILTFRLGVYILCNFLTTYRVLQCVIDLKNCGGWCLSDGVLPLCLLKCSVAHGQVEFTR
ncbi:hypothetical protein AMTRI_Chr05g60370 [Amborella trichopoda]